MRDFIFLLFILFPFHAFSQTQQVKGRVTDEDGMGINGVTVTNVTTQRALTSTDNKGGYAVTVDVGSVLSFKILGYSERKITVKANQDVLNVILNYSSRAVEEVVVRGYVERDKETSTGASSSIDRRDIQDIPVANIETLLQGMVPGMNIQVNTGAPGFRGSTQIRGLSTLSTAGSGSESVLMPTSPLYVIDGVPMDADKAAEMGLEQQGPGISPLSLIPPEDVESIEILKDAQATALYGSQGAYGVVIINTKRGQSEVPRVNYTHSSFFKTPPKLRETLGGNLERRMKLLQIIEHAKTQEDLDRISESHQLSDSLNSYYNNSTNWQSLFYQTTFNQNHNLSVDGGNQMLSYKTNFNYYDEVGIIKNTGFTRYSTNMRMDYSPDPKLKFIGQVFAQIGKQNKGDGTGILQTGVASGGQSSTLLPPPGFYTASPEYVASIKTRNDNIEKSIRPFIEGSYEISPGLRALTTFSYEFNTGTEDKFVPAAANGQFSRVYSYTGRSSRLYSRSSLQYSKSFNEEHNLFFNLFNEVLHYSKQNTVTQQERTPNDQFEGPLGFDGYFSRGGGVLAFSDEKSLSFAIAGSYNYKRKYIIDLSYRMDGSSVNGFEDRYTKNPAVGLRWNLHHEEWTSSLDWMNLASVRLSWGINVMPNSTLERVYGRYDIHGNYNQQQGIGVNFSSVPNPNLKPTTSMQYNLGLDFNILDNKIDVVYDTYYKQVDNLLFEENLDNTTGFDKIYSNNAGIANYGHELAVNLRPLPATSDFFWQFSVNGAYNKDILLKLPDHYKGQYIKWDSENGQNVIYRVGTSTMSNYLLINEGVYSRFEDVPVDPVTGIRYRTSDGTYFEEGDPIWKDQNGDFVLNEEDYVRTGNSQPLFTGGFQSSLRYKNYEMSIGASYTAVRTILNNALANRMDLMRDPFGNKVVVPLDDLDMWKKEGDIAKYPHGYNYTRHGSIRPFRYDQTLWQEDGSYLKINNVVFAYSFDNDFLRRFSLQRFRVYFSMSNVISFSKYSGPNPENVTSMGRDLSNGYPVPRDYTIGLNLSF